MINIKNDDKIKSNPKEENPVSMPKTKVVQESTEHDFTEDQLIQNLKNYIDCNTDGMTYNENTKK